MVGGVSGGVSRRKFNMVKKCLYGNSHFMYHMKLKLPFMYAAYYAMPSRLVCLSPDRAVQL